MRSLVIVILTAGLSLGVVSGVAGWRSHMQQAAGSSAPEVVAHAGIGHPIYAFDPGDDRALAAYATDIFIGRVSGQTGAAGAPTSAPGQELPQSQFAVEVLHLLKGQAAGVVTVNQVGGPDPQAHQIMLLEGDALLRPGARELFLVVSVPERGWYQIIAGGHGHVAADDPAQRQTLIDRFTQATDEPVDFIHFNGAVYLSTAYLAADSPPAAETPLAPGDQWSARWSPTGPMGTTRSSIRTSPAIGTLPTGPRPGSRPETIFTRCGATRRRSVSRRGARTNSSPIRSGATTRRRSAPTCLTSMTG